MNYKSFLFLLSLMVMYLSCSNTSSSQDQQPIIPTKNKTQTSNCKNGRFEKDVFDHFKIHHDVIYGAISLRLDK
jgi:hypothetical protein